MPSIFIRGHHGLGDNLHQRAIVRHFLAEGNDVWIETPWPSAYHDLPVRCMPKLSTLRTQAKNLERERGRFSTEPVPRDAWVHQLRYTGDTVRVAGSVLGGMWPVGIDADAMGFRLPIPTAWWSAASEALTDAGWNTEPIMLFRPLTERAENPFSRQRNPDADAYRALFESIRRDYFVVSVADLEPRKEWLVDDAIDADATFHHGELTFEVLAGLAFISDLVFCAPGFATILAQAVETPCVTVFGGYERGYSFSAGAVWSPYLAIEPIHPCDCFDMGHLCQKAIDVEAARAALEAFVS